MEQKINKKRGRPALPQLAVKNEFLRFRLTKQELEKVQILADKEHVKPSEWVRRLIQKELERAAKDVNL